jgi:hypothetical protein
MFIPIEQLTAPVGARAEAATQVTRPSAFAQELESLAVLFATSPSNSTIPPAPTLEGSAR